MITGASSGIGQAIAERFASEGADVAICSRSAEDVERVAADINDRADEAAGGEDTGDRGQAIALECDVTDREAVETFVEGIVEEFGTIDCFINTAGASFMSSFDDISQNGWETIVDINLHGTYRCTQAAGPYLRESEAEDEEGREEDDGEGDSDGNGGRQAEGGGTVINLASVAGQAGSPYMSHYGAAKAGIVNLTTTLSYEWAEENVRVNCIAPGFVATHGVESQMGVSASEIDRREVARRIGTSEEIADIAQFLASPASSYLVGETITAQGVSRVEESPDL